MSNTHKLKLTAAEGKKYLTDRALEKLLPLVGEIVSSHRNYEDLAQALQGQLPSPRGIAALLERV